MNDPAATFDTVRQAHGKRSRQALRGNEPAGIEALLSRGRVVSETAVGGLPLRFID